MRAAVPAGQPPESPAGFPLEALPAEVSPAGEVDDLAPSLAHFQLDTFRPRQEEIIRAVLVGSRPLVVFPTGGGKSLCYQLPALRLHRRRGGLTVVVSPLQALM